MHVNVSSLFGKSKIKVTQTERAVTPFGGLVSFIEFLNQNRFGEVIGSHMPWQLQSGNAIPLPHTFAAFVFSVVIGARRFAHTGLARADKALHVMLGIPRWPGDDTVRTLFHRFTQGTIEKFWRPVWMWVLGMTTCPVSGFSLDLDSTIFQRAGKQEGAAKGYNPRRPGRKSHHPLLAVLAECQLILHGWLRSGNTGAARGACEFLSEALALMPSGWRIRCVRADSGFFDNSLLSFLEQRMLPYLVVARLTVQLKRQAAGIVNWQAIDEDYSAGEFTAKLLGWSVSRRFVVLRERVRDGKEAVGRKLIDVPGYTFRIWVTNRTESPMLLWRDYNGRATIEQRIEELKNDLAADGFCTKNFWATESAFLAVLFTFNLLSIYQHQAGPNTRYRQPATLRTTVFICGAILGRAGRQTVLHLSEAWGGLVKHKPLIDSILAWKMPTSPKLNNAQDPSPPSSSTSIVICAST